MFRTTLKDLRTAIIAFVVFSVLTGLAYPFAITGIAQAALPSPGERQPVKRDG